MIKRTLFFGNPVYLSTQNRQLHIRYPNDEKPEKSVPIEDLGVVVLEHRQITLSNALMDQLIENQVAVIFCNNKHMPHASLMPMQGHSESAARIQEQLQASLPLKKNLWAQTIQSKISNQAALLNSRGCPTQNMRHWAQAVQSGDAQNHEARAAAYYWSQLFAIDPFKRGREEDPPNNLLNYGYAILRAVCARALVASGLLPIVGIHHKNKYNHYALADDIMEPYRPFVDQTVCYIVDHYEDIEELTPELKKYLLQIPVLDVTMDGSKSPLMVAMSRTTNSLVDCFGGRMRKILYPKMVV